MNAYDLIPKLVRASFEYDRKTIEAISLAIIKKIKLEYPDVASEVAKILSCSGAGTPVIRSTELTPPPVDKDSRYSLIKIDESYSIPEPILDEYTMQQILDFLKEREMIDEFFKQDITPPNSILLDGKPGVGKTYIAKWLAWKLNLPLLTIDLASSISSYLGRSGQNIKSIFDYAKSQNAVLFLDELDAIAKRRDDAADLGELKRLVNVLLKELESCPSSCVIIGATNHPELLDKAIWRRFDRSLTIPMPAEKQRKELISRHLGKYIIKKNQETIDFMVKNTTNINSAEICKLCEHIKRQLIINSDISFQLCVLSEICKIIKLNSKEEKIQMCKTIKLNFKNMSLRDISSITNIATTSISRYLKEE